jgi:hypothetical protein
MNLSTQIDYKSVNDALGQIARPTEGLFAGNLSSCAKKLGTTKS